MSIRAIRRQSTNPAGYPATANSAPCYVDSDDNKLKFIPAGSGTTEVEIVDASTTQTLTNKTLTSPVITGNAVAVTASGGATRLLTLANSGSVNLFDAATGIAYTLPASPPIGVYYDFLVTVLQTSGANVIAVNAAPTLTYLIGSVLSFSGEQVTPSSTLGPYIDNAPLASSFVKTTTNGTTTGGGAGSWFRFLCVSTGAATTWYVTGVNHSPSGSIATLFST
jgi:hypothetical protein